MSSFGRSSEREIRIWWLTLPLAYASRNTGYRSERAVRAVAVLGAQCAVNRRPDRYHGVEERIALPERGFHVEGPHRLVERGADDATLPVQDGERLGQRLLVDFDGALGAGGVGQGGKTCYPVRVRLRVPRTERVGSETDRCGSPP